MVKIKEEKRFKREYVPVVVAVIILFGLIASLIWVSSYKNKNLLKEIPKNDYKQEELVVDLSKSKCSTDEKNELLKSANKVKLSYKQVEAVVGTGVDIDSEGAPQVDLYDTLYDITLSNITEDIYVVITNDKNDKKTTLTHENANKDNEVVFRTENTDLLLTYKVSIYSNKYNCKNEAIRKISFVVPIFNGNYENDECEIYKDFEYCQQMIYADYLTYPEFLNKLDEYKKKNNITTKKVDKEIKENSKHTEIIVGSVVLGIIAIGGITLLVIKKRSKKHEKK